MDSKDICIRYEGTVHIFVQISQVDIKIFHWIKQNDLLVAPEEKSKDHHVIRICLLNYP